MGPLSGIKVLEFEAIGPCPFAGMLLADMGADVLVVDRPVSTDLGLKRERWFDVMMRGKRSVTIDLKTLRGAEAALEQAVAHQDHGLEAEVRRVLLPEIAAQERAQPEQPKQVGRHRAAAQALRLATRLEREASSDVAGHVLQAPDSGPHVAEVGVRQVRVLPVLGLRLVRGMKRHHSRAGLTERQRAQQ